MTSCFKTKISHVHELPSYFPNNGAESARRARSFATTLLTTLVNLNNNQFNIPTFYTREAKPKRIVIREPYLRTFALIVCAQRYCAGSATVTCHALLRALVKLRF